MMGVYQEHIVPHLVNIAMRNRQLAPYRERTIRLAEGRVLEIGVGSGSWQVSSVPFSTYEFDEL